MTNADVIRAWKDEEYREGLGEAALSRLPEHPAGLAELPDADLKNAAGAGTAALNSWGCTCFYTKATRGCGSCRCPQLSFGMLGCSARV